MYVSFLTLAKTFVGRVPSPVVVVCTLVERSMVTTASWELQNFMCVLKQKIIPGKNPNRGGFGIQSGKSM